MTPGGSFRAGPRHSRSETCTKRMGSQPAEKAISRAPSAKYARQAREVKQQKTGPKSG